jgi:mannose-6-phosphate isomerase-like protein (cupin superfamily)
VKTTASVSFLIACALLTAADAPAPASFIGHDTVAGALAKGGVMLKASNLIIQGGHREKAGQVEVHEKETDVIYVQDGEATFVTGGTMIGGKLTSPGQFLGTEILGGEPHHMTKGDAIVVPAGTPHWFRDVPKSISYFVVKVLKP